LDEVPDACAWERAAQTVGELQVASLGKTDQLLEAGCRDLRITSLLPWVDPFMEVISQLMEQQPKTSPRALERGELRTLGGQIQVALSELAELGIPDALGHLDFNPWNILCSTDQCVFLDWAEAYVGPPFFTFEYLGAHMVRQRKHRKLATDVLKAYETAWRNALSVETFSTARSLSPLLAVFAYAAAAECWTDQTMMAEPWTADYLRALTRRMQCEAKLLTGE
jgi:Ser/Thr protein kinase RdoA (MazF antagonist)